MVLIYKLCLDNNSGNASNPTVPLFLFFYSSIFKTPLQKPN